MKKILLLTFVILLANMSLTFGQEITKMNGPLEVRGNSGTPATSGTNQNRIASFSSNDTYGTLYLGNNLGTPFGLWLQSSGRNDLSVNYPLLLNPNGGNVGIGTTSPTTKLSVAGAFTPAYMQIAVKNNTVGEGIGISFNEVNDARKGHIYAQSGNGLIIGDETGYGLRIFSGGSEVLTARNGGNVGIGTTNPTAKLDVNGTANFTNSVLLSGGSGTVANKIGFNADASNYYIQGILNGMQYSPYAVGNFSFTSGNGNWNFTNGNVGIGTIAFPTGYKLAVGGDIIAERVVVKLQANWPDYVFTPSYHRASLQEIEKYINQNHHLPNIPSAQEVSEKGIDIGSMNTKFMEKIEELTLYLIEQNRKLEALEKKNVELENAIKNIKR